MNALSKNKYTCILNHILSEYYIGCKYFSEGHEIINEPINRWNHMAKDIQPMKSMI